MARRPTPVRDRLQARLRAQLEQGRWPVGSWLPAEPALERELDASRTALRAALARLAEQGLLERVPHRGWQVRGRRRLERVCYVRRQAGQAMDRGIEAGLRAALTPAGIALEALTPEPGLPLDRWHAAGFTASAAEHGAVVAFTEYGLPEAWWRELRAAGVRTVCLGCNLHLPYDTVCADFAVMSRELVRAVHARGHRAIAFCGHAHLHRRNPAFRARVTGYELAMRELGLTPAVAYLGDHFEDLDDVDRAFERWFGELERVPSCLYVSGNRFVARIAGVLRRLGYRVPEDISLAGFGLSPEVLHGEQALFERFLHVPEPWFAIGAAAGARLAAAASAELPPTLTLVPSHLVPGDSVRRL